MFSPYRYRALLVLLAVCRLRVVYSARAKSSLRSVRARSRPRPRAELIESINSQAAKIQTVQATVDIDTSVGGAKKGKITDYQQIRGYVLAAQTRHVADDRVNADRSQYRHSTW